MSKTLMIGTITLIAVILAFSGMANAQALIEVSSNTFDFQGKESNPAILTDTLVITNGGDGTLNWAASWNESWLNVVLALGTAPSIVEIKVTAAALSAGDYSDQIVLEAPDAPNSPYNINVNFHVSPPCQGRCGDCNNDGKVNISDAVWIINYVFVNGLPPLPVRACGNANGDSSLGISDAVYIINFIFVGGNAPGDCHPGVWFLDGGDCCPY